MTNNVIYLKDNEIGGILCAYDKDNLTLCKVEKGLISFEQFPDKQSYNWSLGYDLQQNYDETTREEFNQFYTSQSLILNSIVKEL